MDSQHRHDLEENDLQEFFLNFREWWGEWGNTVLTIIAIICVAVAVYLILHTRSVQSHESAWNDLTTSTSPQTLAQVAQEHSGVTSVAILANLRAADLYRAGGQTPQAPKTSAAASQPTTQSEQSTGPKLSQSEQLERATQKYQAAYQLAKASGHELYQLNALQGLAKTAEDSQDWKQAAAYYKQIQALGKSTGYQNFAASATASLADIPRLKQPVTFAPATQPTPAPAATQATKLLKRPSTSSTPPVKKTSPPATQP